MYGTKWYRLDPCFHKGCKAPVTICLYDPHPWDDYEHETNKRYACETHATAYFRAQGHVAEYLPSNKNRNFSG